MSEKNLPMYLDYDQFRKNIVNWSDDTIRRRIANDGLPAIQQNNGRYLIITQDAILWFKRRTVKAG